MALWTPEYIDTALWLDAADSATITLESGAVSQWADKSENARHGTQATAAYRPTVSAAVLGGKDAVLFNGSNQALQIAGGLPVLETMAEFVVFRRALDGIWTMPLGGSIAGSAPYGLQVYTDDAAYSAMQSSAYLTHGTVPTGNRISALTRSAYTAELFIDGATLGGPKTAGALSQPCNIMTVGARASNYHNGLIAEIVVLHHTPSTEERQIIEGYLAHKWGLATNLPGDHPYKTTAPFPFSISGTITGADGNPAARTIRVYNRSTGALLQETTSDASTGIYEFGFFNDNEVVVMAMEDETSLMPDKVQRVIPT